MLNVVTYDAAWAHRSGLPSTVPAADGGLFYLGLWARRSSPSPRNSLVRRASERPVSAPPTGRLSKVTGNYPRFYPSRDVLAARV